MLRVCLWLISCSIRLLESWVSGWLSASTNVVPYDAPVLPYDMIGCAMLRFTLQYSTVVEYSYVYYTVLH